MIRCPQCGAGLEVAEQELHPCCPFCGTAFLLDGARATRHLLLPCTMDRRRIQRAVGDHLARHGVGAPTGGRGDLGVPHVQIYYMPFRRLADGSTQPAFSSHLPELQRFRVPGSDFKLFDPARVADDDLVVEPSGEPLPEEAGIVHYPFARVDFQLGDDDLILWVDAGRGRVVAGNLDAVPKPARASGAGRLLAAAAVTYFALMLLLPFPWSLGAAAVATPLLYRWGVGAVRAAA